MSKAYTAEEAREIFLGQIRRYISFWSRQKEWNEKEKLEGVADSILSIIDGVTGIPGFNLVISTGENDKQYHIDIDEDYYENGMIINEGLYLHEAFNQK